MSGDFNLNKVYKWNGEEEADFVADENIPNGDFAVVVGNRLAIKTGGDTISFQTSRMKVILMYWRNSILEQETEMML